MTDLGNQSFKKIILPSEKLAKAPPPPSPTPARFLVGQLSWSIKRVQIMLHGTIRNDDF